MRSSCPQDYAFAVKCFNNALENSRRSRPGTLSSAFPGCVRALPCFRTQSTGPYSKYTCSGTFSLCCPKILPIRSPVRLFRTLPPSLWRTRHFLPCRLSPPGPAGPGLISVHRSVPSSFFRLSLNLFWNCHFKGAFQSPALHCLFKACHGWADICAASVFSSGRVNGNHVVSTF